MGSMSRMVRTSWGRIACGVPCESPDGAAGGLRRSLRRPERTPQGVSASRGSVEGGR
jgi:hypothetical protein